MEKGSHQRNESTATDARTTAVRLRSALDGREPGLVGEQAARLFRLIEDTPPDEIGVELHRLTSRPHRAVLLTAMPDCAFIVETLQEMLASEGYAILALLHPILLISRDAEGRVTAIGDRVGFDSRTSATMILFEGLESEGEADLEAEVGRRLSHVRLATSDFRRMVEDASRIRADLENLKADLGRKNEQIVSFETGPADCHVFFALTPDREGFLPAGASLYQDLEPALVDHRRILSAGRARGGQDHEDPAPGQPPGCTRSER